MAQHIKMPRAQSDLIDAWAKRHGISKPEAIRRLIAKGLEVDKLEV
ncbi:ribbon-helix-helix protein, CopG family [Novacetimonas hansenii]|nr:ribbon-helix-helix protein, CopG family [Novacetimonas hansenii]